MLLFLSRKNQLIKILYKNFYYFLNVKEKILNFNLINQDNH